MCFWFAFNARYLFHTPPHLCFFCAAFTRLCFLFLFSLNNLPFHPFPNSIINRLFFTSARSLILPVPPRHSFPLFLGDPGRALPYFSPPFPLLWSPSPLLSLSFPSLPLFPSLILAARRSIPRRARWGKVSNREKGKTGKEGTERGR